MLNIPLNDGVTVTQLKNALEAMEIAGHGNKRFCFPRDVDGHSVSPTSMKTVNDEYEGNIVLIDAVC